MQAASTFIDELEGAVTRLKDAGGMVAKGQTGEKRLGVWALENLPLAERIGNPESFSARQDIDGLLTQGVLALIPVLSSATVGGKNFDAKAEMDNLKKSLASAQDYDSAMRSIGRWRQRIAARLAAPATSAAPRGRGSSPATPRQRVGNRQSVRERIQAIKAQRGL